MPRWWIIASAIALALLAFVVTVYLLARTAVATHIRAKDGTLLACDYAGFSFAYTYDDANFVPRSRRGKTYWGNIAFQVTWRHSDGMLCQDPVTWSLYPSDVEHRAGYVYRPGEYEAKHPDR